MLSLNGWSQPLTTVWLQVRVLPGLESAVCGVWTTKERLDFTFENDSILPLSTSRFHIPPTRLINFALSFS
jgi:hypothetical protein